uniref:Uncharacterized protein n=1 Tax=Steinernema glaseri TaxID=37863 RepID=A0A1I8AIF9_9BILA
MSQSESSSVSTVSSVDEAPSTIPEEVAVPFSRDIEEMVETIAHWMEKKEDLIEELIHLNDQVFAKKLGEHEVEVRNVIEKYLPEKETEVPVPSEQSGLPSTYSEEGSSYTRQKCPCQRSRADCRPLTLKKDRLIRLVRSLFNRSIVY